MKATKERQGLEYLDDLTGLYNRRYFKERLLAERRSADQRGTSFALVMIDLDNFKPINDLHGHLTGDRVLSQVGRILKESIRSTDTLCRYAGDEFVAILPEIDEKDVIRIAKRVKEKLAHTEWLDEKGEPLEPVTCSLGYAIYSEAGRDLNGLMDWADQALYAVKHRGGDGYCGEGELAKKPTARPFPTAPSIIGRDKELRWLKSVLEEVREEGGKLIEVSGEAGIGKTRLVREFQLYVERRRGVTLRGGCREEMRNIPYYPLREALSKFFEEGREDSIPLLKSLPDYSQKELARIIPNLREHRSVGFERAADPFRLFESTRLLLQGIAAQAPVPLLFILEDLQWSDTATIELLYYLARSLRTAPVLLCVTYRAEERAPALSELTESLRKLDLVREIHLTSLSARDTATMIRLLYPARKMGKHFKDSLYEKTEGNPFFVEELLRLIRDEEFEQADLQNLEIPESLTALLERRIASLEPAVRETLSLSALIGGEFEFDVLRRVSEKPEHEVLTAIEEASRAQIVRESLERPDDSYRFTHSLMADVLYSRIGKLRRKMWHGRVGDALLEVYKERLGELNGRLTHHFEKAGEWKKAATHALRSAVQAKDSYANQLAVRLFEKVRRILPRLAEAKDEEESQIAEGLGDVYQLMGNYDKALEEYGHVQEFALQKEDKKREAEALLKMSRVYQHKGDYDEMMRHAEKSHKLSRDLGDGAGIADTLHAMGNVYWSKGDYSKAKKFYNEALSKRKEIKDMRTAASSLHNIGNIHSEQGEYDQALKRYGESLAIRREADDKRGAASSLNSIGNVHADRGDYSKALGFYEESLALRREIGDIRGVASTLQNIGTVYADTGEYEKALDCYEKALKVQRQIGSRREVAVTLSNIGIIHSNRGKYDDALLCYEDSLNIRKEIGDKHGAAINLHNIAVVYENRGDYSEAMKRHKQSFKMKSEMGDRSGVALSVHSMGVIHAARGEYTKAAQLLTEALSIRRGIGEKKGVASSILNIGTLHAHRGEYDRALNYYQQALDLQADVGHRWGRALTMQEIGTLYQDLFYMDGAKDSHQKSLDLMQELGLDADKPGLLASMGMDHYLSGDDGLAVKLLNEALVMTRQLGSREAEPGVLEGLALVWLSLGNDLEARHYCERLTAVATERGLKRHLAAAKRIRGEILLKEAASSQSPPARWDDAEAELKEAANKAKRIGELPLLWRIHESLAKFYEKKGDDKRRRIQLEKAREVIERIVSNISDRKLTRSFLESKQVLAVLTEKHS
jgi:diguanylate cyclase (GGDEF)-like protein